MTIPTMQEMLEAGVHFGHKTSRWNPKMAPFIFTERNKIHIFDLAQTVEMLERACKFLEKITKESGTILFVGTKKQAGSIVKKEAERASMPYITNRWLGGTLTNFETIKKRIRYFKELESKDLFGLSKKEKAQITSEQNKLKQIFEGIKNLNDLPHAIFIVDVLQEKTAIREAKKLEIPIIALVDTNGDPNLADYVIPGNDDATGSIKIIVQTIAEAIVGAKTQVAEKETVEKTRKPAEEENRIKEAEEKVKKVSKVAKVAKVEKKESTKIKAKEVKTSFDSAQDKQKSEKSKPKKVATKIKK